MFFLWLIFNEGRYFENSKAMLISLGFGLSSNDCIHGNIFPRLLRTGLYR